MKMLYALAITYLFTANAYSASLPLLLQIEQGKGLHELEIRNTAPQKTKSYRLKIREVSFPNADMKVLDEITHDIWLSELAFTIKPGDGKLVKLGYRGKPSDIERYFQLQLAETSSKKDAIGGELRTLVTVLPLNSSIVVKQVGNTLTNEGKASVLFMEDLDCGNTEGVTHLLSPGASMALPKLKEGAIHSIGVNNEIKLIASSCNE